MTLCPIALAASCKQCAVVSVCPLKTVIGDYPKAESDNDKNSEKKSSGTGK
jgi:hypothetical protein